MARAWPDHFTCIASITKDKHFPLVWTVMEGKSANQSRYVHACNIFREGISIIAAEPSYIMSLFFTEKTRERGERWGRGEWHMARKPSYRIDSNHTKRRACACQLIRQTTSWWWWLGCVRCMWWCCRSYQLSRVCIQSAGAELIKLNSMQQKPKILEALALLLFPAPRFGLAVVVPESF